MSDPPTRDELVEAGVLDPYQRVQAGLTRADVYPARDDGLCACGCGLEVEPPRRRYALESCAEAVRIRFSILYGHSSTIRWNLYRREGGNPYGKPLARCQRCDREVLFWGQWEAHHIVPVEEGGGACELEGFELLCSPCHAEEHG